MNKQQELDYNKCVLADLEHKRREFDMSEGEREVNQLHREDRERIIERLEGDL